MPIQYAATQNNLGVSYRSLSEIEDVVENCKNAIQSYENALEVYNKDQFPIQYATTQYNIAGAYSTLAESLELKSNSERAIKSYREAQTVFTQQTYADIYDRIEEDIEYLNSIAS